MKIDKKNRQQNRKLARARSEAKEKVRRKEFAALILKPQGMVITDDRYK